MPIQWTIDADRKRVTMVASGDITRGDFEELHVALRAAGAHAYAKLFDGLLGRMRLTTEDVLMLGAHVRSQHAEGPVGPLAVVLTARDSELIAPLLGMLAVADRPMRVFNEFDRARRWINSRRRPPEGPGLRARMN
jgi:1,6-anhydro-N-acetylmuramate kinase